MELQFFCTDRDGSQTKYHLNNLFCLICQVLFNNVRVSSLSVTFFIGWVLGVYLLGELSLHIFNQGTLADEAGSFNNALC